MVERRAFVCVCVCVCVGRVRACEGSDSADERRRRQAEGVPGGGEGAEPGQEGQAHRQGPEPVLGHVEGREGRDEPDLERQGAREPFEQTRDQSLKPRSTIVHHSPVSGSLSQMPTPVVCGTAR